MAPFFHSTERTSDTARPVFVYEVASGPARESRYFVSPLPNEHVFQHGLPDVAIMGELSEGPEQMVPEKFKQNSAFVRFLGWVITKHSASCPGLLAEAKRQQNGYVYILDLRTPTPDDAVPPEDIIGGVEVKDGELVRFHVSPNYRLFTKDGFMRLDAWIHDRLLEELMSLPSQGNGNERENVH